MAERRAAYARATRSVAFDPFQRPLFYDRVGAMEGAGALRRTDDQDAAVERLTTMHGIGWKTGGTGDRNALERSTSDGVE